MTQQITAPTRFRPRHRPADVLLDRDPLGVAVEGPFTVALPDGDEISVRLAGFHDTAVLRTVFVEGRADEFADLPPQLSASLLEMQHAAHLRARRRDWPRASDYVLEQRCVPCGRLTVDAGEHFRVLDLSLLPGFRGRRVGRSVLRAVARRAVDHDRTVRLRVRREDVGSRLLADLDCAVVGVGDTELEIEVRG